MKVTGQWHKIYAEKFKATGKSFNWFSKQAQIPRRSLERIMNGESEPKVSQHERICKTLKITL